MNKLHKIMKQISVVSALALTGFSINATEVPALAPPLPAKQGSTVISADWLLNASELAYESTLDWLDDNHIIYVLPTMDSQKESKIELFDLQTNTHKLLTDGTTPKPSPDGKWIAFIRGQEESKQLWIIREDKSEEKQVSHVEGGLGVYRYSFNFVWSPDSKKMVIHHQTMMEQWENKPRPHSMIDSIDIATGESKQLADIDASIRYLSWLTKTNEVLFVKERVGRQYQDEMDNEWIQALNTKDGKIRTLLHFDSLQQFLTPKASKDGQSIALLYDAEHPIFTFMLSIGFIPANSDADSMLITPTQLTHEMQLDYTEWSNDDKALYARRIYGAYQQLCKIDATTGEASQITNTSSDIEYYAVSPDEHHITWIGHDAHDVLRLQVASNDGSNVRDLVTQKPYQEDMALSEVREIEWKTPDYPVNMRGLLVMPLGYTKNKQYPLIVDIHGGDMGAALMMSLGGGMLNNTPLEWQLWAAKGYMVFAPEFRSSANFGSLATTRDQFQDHDRLGGDLKDIEAGVDSLIAQNLVDLDRLAIIGHSAGALRANWFVVATHRYKAIVSKEGWADEYTPDLIDPPSYRINVMYGGSPWEVPENYLKNSPLQHAAGATTPTLFLMGSADKGGVDPHQTVLDFYTALKNLGVSVEYVSYPNEGHVFEQEVNRRDSLARADKWIAEHLAKPTV